jgi:hypothetical protein
MKVVPKLQQGVLTMQRVVTSIAMRDYKFWVYILIKSRSRDGVVRRRLD